jgi:hypothetical protein
MPEDLRRLHSSLKLREQPNLNRCKFSVLPSKIISPP